MTIETQGAHWIRAHDRAHALALLTTLDGAPDEWPDVDGTFVRGAGWMAYLQGEVQVPTGETETVNGIELPAMATKKGYYVLLTAPDILPPETLDPWVFRWPDDQPWPIEIGGWGEQIEVCQELAEDVDERLAIDDTVPAKLTDAQREAIRDVRAQILDVLTPWLRRKRQLDNKRRQVERFKARIDDAPGRRSALANRITELQDRRAPLIVQRDALDAIIDDETESQANRRQARDDKQPVVDQISALTDRIASVRARRQAISDALQGWRDARTEAAAERSTLFDAMQADRPGVQSQLQTLRAQRQTILGAS